MRGAPSRFYALGLILAGVAFFPTPLPLGVPFITAGLLVWASRSERVRRRLNAVVARYPAWAGRVLRETKKRGPAFVRRLADDLAPERPSRLGEASASLRAARRKRARWAIGARRPRIPRGPRLDSEVALR